MNLYLGQGALTCDSRPVNAVKAELTVNENSEVATLSDPRYGDDKYYTRREDEGNERVS